MKNFWPIVFVSSLVLNTALVGVFLAGARAPLRPSATAAALTVAALPASASPPLDPTVWPRLHPDDDLPALIARLRAAGFPPEIITGLITGLVEEKFAARRRALDPDSASRPFWKTPGSFDSKLQAARAQLDREQRHLLHDLLGSEVSSGDPFSALEERRQSSYLPAEKVAQLKELNDRYAQLSADVRASGGALLPEERTRMAELEKEQRAAIVQLLSPAELEAHDLRYSQSANLLRSQLGLFDLSENEFLTLYQLRRPFDEKYGYVFGVIPDEETVRQRPLAEKALNEQFKSVLGPDRYADFERSGDYTYSRATQLVARLGLPPAAATEIWSVQKDTQQRVADLKRDTTMPEAQRTAQLTALTAEATTRLTTALGERGLAEYRINGGAWLNSIAPAASPPKN